MDLRESEQRARVAYELGRLGLGARRALWALPAIACALWLSEGAAGVTGLAIVLVLAITALTWRGEAWGAGVFPGLFAGMVPLGTVGVVRLQHACAVCEIPYATCFAASAGAGLIVGAATVWLTLRRAPGRRAIFLVSASAIAALVGAMGCVLFGLPGLIGLAIGLALGPAPLLAARAART